MWRKADGGWWIDGDAPIFHAYDINDNAACSPNYGLMATCEQPNEGSELCASCIDVCRMAPSGRIATLP